MLDVRSGDPGQIAIPVRRTMNEYSRANEIRWSDLDANNHVNYSTYIDAAGDLRYRFFAEHGFPPERFAQLGVGPT